MGPHVFQGLLQALYAAKSLLHLQWCGLGGLDSGHCWQQLPLWCSGYSCRWNETTLADGGHFYICLELVFHVDLRVVIC